MQPFRSSDVAILILVAVLHYLIRNVLSLGTKPSAAEHMENLFLTGTIDDDCYSWRLAADPHPAGHFLLGGASLLAPIKSAMGRVEFVGFGGPCVGGCGCI